MEIISVALLAVQLGFGLYKRAAGIWIFVFILIVFPTTMPLTSFFGLGLVKSSTLIAFLLSPKWKKNLNLNYFYALLVFLIMVMPSFLFCENSSGMYNFLFKFFIMTFLPGIIIYKYIAETNEVGTFFSAVVAAMLVMCLYGIFELVVNMNPLVDALRAYSEKITIFEYTGVSKVRLGFARRIQSTAWHPIAFGGYISLILPLILCPFFNLTNSIFKNPLNLKSKSKVFYFCLVGLMLFNLFICLSRSAWLAAVLGLAYIIVTQRNFLLKKNKDAKILLIVLALPFIGYGIYIAIQLISNSTFGGSSIDLRVSQANYIYSLIQNDLFLGLGDDAIKNFLNKGIAKQAYGFESILMAFIVNHGIVGFLGYMTLYGSTFFLMFFPKKTIFTSFSQATLIAHLAFVVLTGEMETTRFYWLLFSFYFAAHVNLTKPKQIIVVNQTA